jgi:hypothetical protein
MISFIVPCSREQEYVGYASRVTRVHFKLVNYCNILVNYTCLKRRSTLIYLFIVYSKSTALEIIYILVQASFTYSQ